MRKCSVRVGAINARNKRNCINIVKQDNSPKIKNKKVWEWFSSWSWVDNEEYWLNKNKKLQKSNNKLSDTHIMLHCCSKTRKW